MLQGEKASALSEWLSAAGAIQSEAQQRVADVQSEVERRYESEVAQVSDELDVIVLLARSECQAKITAAKSRHSAECASIRVDSDQELATCGSAKLEGPEKQITRVRQQAEEAEQLAAMLKTGRERPNEHLCSITRDVMRDPVMVVSCGDTFERSAIEKWFKIKDTCPLCREQSDKKVAPNKAVKKMIQDWK
jgi:hypothetical protein